MNLKPFDITQKDRAWCAQLRALELSFAVKGFLAEGGRLMKIIEETDSLTLYKWTGRIGARAAGRTAR